MCLSLQREIFTDSTPIFSLNFEPKRSEKARYACIAACISRRRRRWILVTGILAILSGSLLNYYYRSLIWDAATEALWFTLLGLPPILGWCCGWAMVSA